MINASSIYINNKVKLAKEVGIKAIVKKIEKTNKSDRSHVVM